MNNNSYMAYSYAMMIRCMNGINSTDSARFYAKRCLETLEIAHNNTKDYIYSTLGNFYINRDNNKAHYFFSKVSQQGQDNFFYYSLGKLYYTINENSMAIKAFGNVNKAKETNKYKADAYNNISHIYRINRKFIESQKYTDLAIAAKDSIFFLHKTYDIGGLQKQSNDSLNWQNQIHKIIHLVTIIIFCILLYVIYTHKYTKRLSKIVKLYRAKHKIENAIHHKNIDKERKKHQHQLEKLHYQINNIQNNSNNNIRQGKQLYIGLISQNKNISLWTQKDFDLCLAYCEIEYTNIVLTINNEHSSLKSRNKLMLILKAQGYDNDTIARIYGVMPDSIRRALSRIKPN